jgi:leucine dehydrogenase
MKTCAGEVFGSDSLQGRTIAIQGFGKVGSALASNLKGEGAHMIVSEVRPEAANRAREDYGAEIVDSEAIYDVPCDIFAPCAWGGILNSETIPRLKCKIVAGSANNQLQDRIRHAGELQERGILYAPEYIINAGGFVNIASEVGGYKPEKARAKIEKIPGTLEKILSMAKTGRMTTLEAADRLALECLRKAGGGEGEER